MTKSQGQKSLATSQPDCGDEPGEKETRCLLDHLAKETFVALKPSKIAGVGVLAIRDIPAGVDPFPMCNTHMFSKERFSVISADVLRDLHPNVLDQVRSFF